MNLPIKPILVTVVGLIVSFLIVGAISVRAFPTSPISTFVAQIAGIPETALQNIIDASTGKISLSLIPMGAGSGLDADTLQGHQPAYFATASDLTAAEDSLNGKLSALNSGSGTSTSSSGSSDNALLDTSETFTGILTLSKLPILSSLTVAGVVHNSATGVLSSSTVSGSDLSPSITISTSGNIATTSTATITSAGLLTASNGLTLTSGTFTLPSNSIADAALSTNIALLSGAQTFSGSKVFSAAISVPTTSNSINGLIINSGALSGITTLSASGAVSLSSSLSTGNLTSSTGALTSTVADGASAVGFLLATSTTYSTSGANLLQIKNNATAELTLDKSGNLTAAGTGSFGGNVTPSLDATYNLGSATLRWGSAYFSGDVNVGDMVLNNNFRFREDGPHKVDLLNPNGVKIASFDDQGNLWLRGKLYDSSGTH